MKKTTVKEKEQVAVNSYSISIEQLAAQLQDKEKVRSVLENQYTQVQGQIVLLQEQIMSLKKGNKEQNK